MAQGVNLTVIYSREYSLLHWAEQITGMDNPPLVHSVSYGNDEKQQTGAACKNDRRHVEPGSRCDARPAATAARTQR